MAKHTEDKKALRKAVVVKVRAGTDDVDDAAARMLTRPEVQAACLVQQLQGDNHEVNALVREFERQVEAVQGGDLKRGEAMLVAQAHALDELFGNLARRAATNFSGGYRDAGETYLRLALKAQSQCRNTWETLAEIKNPRHVAFVRQANIAHGPQQVNNGTVSRIDAPARAENAENQSIGLLENDNGQRLDTGTKGAAGEASQELATMDSFVGTED